MELLKPLQTGTCESLVNDVCYRVGTRELTGESLKCRRVEQFR